MCFAEEQSECARLSTAGPYLCLGRESFELCGTRQLGGVNLGSEEGSFVIKDWKGVLGTAATVFIAF